MQRLGLLVALVVLGAAGCEKGTDYGDLELVDVTGKVTLDGQPLAGATVRFEGPPNRFADGLTDAEGKYRLMYDSNQPGCLPGDKTVRIIMGNAVEGGDEGTPVEGPDGTVAPQASAAKSIPPQYNSQSTLKANVSATSKAFDFDLKSAP